MSPTLKLLLGAVIIFLAVCCVCSVIQASQRRARNNNNPNFFKEKLKEKTLKNVQSKRRQTARDIMLLREELKQAETRLLEESKYEQELQESYRQRLIEDTKPKKQKRDNRLRNRRARLGDSPNFSEADDQDFKEPITVEIGKEKNTRVRNPYKHPVERGEDIFTLIWKKLKQYQTPAKDHKSDEDFLLEDANEESEKPTKLDFFKINVLDRKKSKSKYLSDDFREETPPTPTEIRHIENLRTPSHDEASKEDLYFTPRKKDKRKKKTETDSAEDGPPIRFSPIFTPLSYIKDKLVYSEKNSYEFGKVAPDEIQVKKHGTIEEPESFSIVIDESPIRMKSEEKRVKPSSFTPAVRPLSRAPTSLKPLKISPHKQRDSARSLIKPVRESSLTSSEVRKPTFTNLSILDTPRTKEESLPVSSRQKKPPLIDAHPLHSKKRQTPQPAPESQTTFERSREIETLTPPTKEGQFHEMDGLDFVAAQSINRKIRGKAEDSIHLKKLKPIGKLGDTKRREGLIYASTGDIKRRPGLVYPGTSASTKQRKPPRQLKSSRIPRSPLPESGSPNSPSPPVEITIKSPRELGIKHSERFDSSKLEPPPSKSLKLKRKLTKKRLSGVKSPAPLIKKQRPGSKRAKIKTTSRPGTRGKIGLANEEVELLTREPNSPLIPDEATMMIDDLISATTPIPNKSKSKKTRNRKLRGLIDEDKPSQVVKVKRQKLEAEKQSEESSLGPTEKIRVKPSSRRDKRKQGPKLSRMTSARRKRKPK